MKSHQAGGQTHMQERVAGSDIFDPPALTPLTGRDTEVGLLKDRWEQAVEGMGQIVLIVGEPGLGKSRLVGTIKEYVQESASTALDAATEIPVIEWHCSQWCRDTGLHPVTDYFASLLGLDRDESSSARFDRLAEYLESCGLDRVEAVALFARLLFLPADERYPAPGLPPVREREEIFRVLRQWLRVCATRQPILFVVEDLHWVDASTLEFLSEFIAEGFNDRILTVFTFRPEFKTPWPALAHQTSLALNRLTRRQVAALMRKDAGRSVPESLVTQICERTKGVPLLVEEYTRIIRESAGNPMHGEDHSECERDMPATLQALVLGRLDYLSSNRELAQLAATLGREFHYEMLAAVAPVDEPVLRDELNKLARAEILYVKGQPPHCVYKFKHALLEEALHDALDAGQRREFHRRVAEILETRFPQSVDKQPELLALHFTEAGLADKASTYWLKAGKRARDQFANIEAINHFKRGLELLAELEEAPGRDARELDILGPLGTAYIAARGYAAPEVGPVFRRARLLSERVGETPQIFAMLRGNFAFHIVRGDFRLCADLAGEAMEFAERIGDPGLFMEALFLKGLTMLYRGDFEGARDCCERAIVEYDDRERTAFWATFTGENAGVIHRCYLALAWWHLGYVDRALAVNEDARELAISIRQPFDIEYALHHTGWLHQHCRLGVKTQAAGEEEMRIAAEQGFPFWHASGMLYSAAGLLLQGRLETGLRLLQKGLDAYRGTGAGLGLPYYLGILGEALTRAGRFEEAHGALNEALVLAERNDERFQEAELQRLKGELLLEQSDDQAQAEQCFSSAIALARKQGSRAWELRATTSLARLRRRQQRRDEAFAELTTILDSFTEGLTMPDLVEADALQKELSDERMREDLAAGIKYFYDRMPPPIHGNVSVDWRFVPASTLGGDTLGYHWIDKDHLALYLIDVTGHGLDSALFSVTVNNVIRAGSLPEVDMRRPEQVLRKLNETFQGHLHGYRFFTIWYGVYHLEDRTVTYAAGGHPPAIVVSSENSEPLTLSATGPLMGVLSDAEFGVHVCRIPADGQLLIFSDGVFEIFRDKQLVWNLSACVAYLTTACQAEGGPMDELLARVRQLRGSQQLDDDFSIICARFG